MLQNHTEIFSYRLIAISRSMGNMDAEKQLLDFFGSFLMQHLRDQAGRFYELMLQGKGEEYSPELSAFLISLPSEQQEWIKQCVLLSMDNSLHNFLFQIGQFFDQDLPNEDAIQMLVNGQDIVPLSDDISAELFGQNGWIRKYSQFPRRDV